MILGITNLDEFIPGFHHNITIYEKHIALSFEKPPFSTDIGEFVTASFDVDLECDEQDTDFPNFQKTDFFISIHRYRELLRSNIIIKNLPLVIWCSRKK